MLKSRHTYNNTGSIHWTKMITTGTAHMTTKAINCPYLYLAMFRRIRWSVGFHPVRLLRRKHLLLVEMQAQCKFIFSITNANVYCSPRPVTCCTAVFLSVNIFGFGLDGQSSYPTDQTGYCPRVYLRYVRNKVAKLEPLQPEWIINVMRYSRLAFKWALRALTQQQQRNIAGSGNRMLNRER